MADMPCGRPHFVIVDLTDEKVIYEIQRDELCTSAICCDNVFYYLLGKQPVELTQTELILRH